MKKVLFVAANVLLFTVIAIASNYLVWYVLFYDAMTDEAFDGLWRAMNDPLWKYGPWFACLFYGLSFYFAYSIFRKALIAWCPIRFVRGVKFGLIIWLFIGFVGGIFWFSAHRVSEELFFGYILEQLITLAIGGGTMSFIYDKFIDKANE